MATGLGYAAIAPRLALWKGAEEVNTATSSGRTLTVTISRGTWSRRVDFGRTRPALTDALERFEPEQA